MSKGTLTFELDGLSQEELNRIRKIIDVLFETKVFWLKNGSAELNFNAQSELAAINFKTSWRKIAQTG